MATGTVRNIATSFCKSGDEYPKEPTAKSLGRIGGGTGHFSFPCKQAANAKVYLKVKIQYTEMYGPSTALWVRNGLVEKQKPW